MRLAFPGRWGVRAAMMSCARSLWTLYKLINKFSCIPNGSITSRNVFLTRRTFLLFSFPSLISCWFNNSANTRTRSGSMVRLDDETTIDVRMMEIIELTFVSVNSSYTCISYVYFTLNKTSLISMYFCKINFKHMMWMLCSKYPPY